MKRGRFMNNLDSFFAGLLLGEQGVSLPAKKVFNRNIALQDVVFCQSLKNAISEIADFVEENNPTPEQFIKYLLPDLSQIEEPYTNSEKEQIARQRKCIEEFKDEWKFKDWENTPLVKRIWADASHTPDIDNLHLLFGAGTGFPPTVKYNGRVYEYVNGLYFNNFAKGFFESLPAKLILSSCKNFTFNYLRERGYNFDRDRFDFDAASDKAGTLDKWRESCRKKEYWNMLKYNSKFATSPWSPLTKKLFEAHKAGKRTCWFL